MTFFSHPAVVALCALFMWWFSTGVVLYIVGLPGCSSRKSVLGAVVLFIGALYGLARSSGDTSVAGAYQAFICALLVWGVQEFEFLIGSITGPRRDPCPDDCVGWRRVGYALQAIVYHEIALILSGAAIVAVTWNAENKFGTWTFAILWTMRVSAKLNLFLGVPVLNHEFLPTRLNYLTSYFRRAPIGFFFALTVTASTTVTALLLGRGLTGDASAFESTGYMLLASLMALGVLEHWFMALPLPIAALWSWGMRSRVDRVRTGSVASLAQDRLRNIVSKVPDP
jgi:putative photosynthetic complex assembly protein 2